MYEGIVTALGNIQPIPNKDRIVAAQLFVDREQNIAIANIVTGIEYPAGTLGIYFGQDIQLSQAFADAHGLLRPKGYLDPDKRRITVQRFAGVKSEGLWLPLHQVEGATQFKLGDRVTEINKIEICKRYPKPQIVQRTNNRGSVERQTKIVVDMPKHVETDQLLHNIPMLSRIPIGSIVTITEKLHGTSHRYGNVKINYKLNWFQRQWNRFTRWWLKWDGYLESEYKHMHGTRNVILFDPADENFYGTNQFRYDALDGVLLNEDEIIYGELVGYAGPNKLIMPEHDLSKTPKTAKEFGQKNRYLYGCDENETQFYVYRITQGPTHKDLPFDRMCDRANELGLMRVPVLDVYAWDGDVAGLVARVDKLVEPNGESARSTLGEHMAEGICVRFDMPDGSVVVYKRKSFAFKVAEGIADAPTGEDAS